MGYLITTRPDGEKGYNVYIDGVLRASSPYAGVGVDETEPYHINEAMAGSPTDPPGPIRICGKEKPVDLDDPSKGTVYDYRRFFHGKIAHVSIWDAALSEEQVKELLAAYDREYPPISVIAHDDIGA